MRARALFVLVWVIRTYCHVVVHCRDLSCRLVLVFGRALLWLRILVIVMSRTRVVRACAIRTFVSVSVSVSECLCRVCALAISQYAHEAHVRTCHVCATLASP